MCQPSLDDRTRAKVKRLHEPRVCFYPIDAMRKRGLCCRHVEIWMSVRLSHTGIVSERLNLS